MQNMNDQELHRQLIDALTAHDFATLRASYAPDFEYRGPDGELGDVEVALGVAQLYSTAFPDLAFEVVHQWSPTENASIVEYRASGTHLGELGDIAATGRGVSGIGCNIIEVHDGKVTREREYADSMPLMRQLGIVS